ncbi:rod shape-determining protein MreD [Methylovulum psychrotolerans]|jgi:rod shape-determining protein MreD|uniref:Rod shape-determining protein MreD n=1 Tax=Methylovulum psychrotolerans TaxID=1704499 RepID=A0A1Z4C4F4_9GAMM|nr:rod shape-determining protein MreD [Methylovulum psychrotolerans]ASF48421.1 rod shape-determining protein MreD [Methylovulum psychrotolerans]MBT9099205.1 rod shape-determining protein MreD [Methylovulum psychrotolerans]POZ50791.1 rod shape-determining protein MreD [Methylovulum psychrotolerans]
MTNTYGFGRILISIGVAMCLRIAPLPFHLDIYNPDWVLMVLIYWSIGFPERVGIFHAWSFGLLTDVLTGRLLGQYALAYSLVIYICLKLHKRLRHFPLLQQELFIFACLLLSQLLLFLIKNLQHPAQLHGDFWWPVLSGTLCWPFVYLTLRFVRLSKPVN